MKKRLIGTVGVIAASAAVLTGCGGGDDAAQSSGDGSFSYMMPDRQMAWLNDQKFMPAIAEATGVTAELVDGGPQGEYYQRVDLDIASKGLGDAAIVSLAQMQVYGPQGAFVDLAPLIAEHGPHIQRYIDEHPEFASLVTQDDGAIYGLILERPRIGAVTMYRTDMFEKAGIEEVPKNIAHPQGGLRRRFRLLPDDGSRLLHEPSVRLRCHILRR
jgi:putative aldouronate transport system substrate-binding protein